VIGMTYTIITPKAVQKQLDALPDDVYDRIAEKIEQLAENPRPDGVVKMKGSDHEYRIRIGDYRVRYEIDDKELIILLLQCKHRKDVYRK
jgi:mRNA interferase RelE/StbE